MIRHPLHSLPVAALAAAAVAWFSFHPVPASADEDDGFVDLFDGESLEGWIVPDNQRVWRVDDGSIARRPAGGYIWTEGTYGDFILELEFKISRGCNSGLFFRADRSNPVQAGLEIQVLDSHGRDPGKHQQGALYDAAAPLVNSAKPAGEWQTMRLHAEGPKLVVHINDEKVLDLDLDDWDTAGKNPDGSDNKYNKALKDFPREGHIGFQDHGADVWYRNVRLKELN